VHLYSMLIQNAKALLQLPHGVQVVDLFDFRAMSSHIVEFYSCELETIFNHFAWFVQEDSDEAGEIEALQLEFQARRCFYLGETQRAGKKFENYFALVDLAIEKANEAIQAYALLDDVEGEEESKKSQLDATIAYFKTCKMRAHAEASLALFDKKVGRVVT
jgi:hypothetical protein